MKLFVKDPRLLAEMFKPLIGKTVRIVISGKPETAVLLHVSTETLDLEIRVSDELRSVRVKNIWEITAPVVESDPPFVV